MRITKNWRRGASRGGLKVLRTYKHDLWDKRRGMSLIAGRGEEERGTKKRTKEIVQS